MSERSLAEEKMMELIDTGSDAKMPKWSKKIWNEIGITKWEQMEILFTSDERHWNREINVKNEIEIEIMMKINAMFYTLHEDFKRLIIGCDGSSLSNGWISAKIYKEMINAQVFFVINGVVMRKEEKHTNWILSITKDWYSNQNERRDSSRKHE